MNDLTSDDPAATIAHEASRLLLSVAVQKAAEIAGRATYSAQIGSGSSTARRFALQNAIKAVKNFGREALRKSEADSVVDATSPSFDIGPSTSNQTASQETRALAVTALAARIGRKLQEFGGSVDNADDVAAALTATMVDYSYGNHESLDQMEARAATNARESGFVWSSNLTDQRANDEADSLNAGMGVESNFSGRRNDPRAVYSAAGAETGFSSAATRSVSPGTPDGATSSDQSIAEIAARAYAAGMLAGRAGGPVGGFSAPAASDPTAFAKARQRSNAAANRRGR